MDHGPERGPPIARWSQIPPAMVHPTAWIVPATRPALRQADRMAGNALRTVR
jgi:hypothetical protein